MATWVMPIILLSIPFQNRPRFDHLAGTRLSFHDGWNGPVFGRFRVIPFPMGTVEVEQ